MAGRYRVRMCKILARSLPVKADRSGVCAAVQAAARSYRLGWSMAAGAMVAALSITTMPPFTDGLGDAVATRAARESTWNLPSSTHGIGGFPVAMCKETDGACTPGTEGSRRAA